jgi:hypothetical protein
VVGPLWQGDAGLLKDAYFLWQSRSPAIIKFYTLGFDHAAAFHPTLGTDPPCKRRQY